MDSTLKEHAESDEAIKSSPEEHAENNEGVPSADAKKRKSADIRENPPFSNKKAFKLKTVVRSSHVSAKSRAEVESIYANSQRILRETKRTSFTAEVVVQKPVSSLIEKIRQRRIQLAPRVTKLSASVSHPVKAADNLGCERVDDNPISNETDTGPSKSGLVVEQDCSDGDDVRHESTDDVPVAISLREETNDISGSNTPQTTADTACKSSPTRSFRVPMLDSMDLWPDSQTMSPSKSDLPIAGDGAEVPTDRARLRLHLDSETQDDDFNRVLEDKREQSKDSDRANEELWSTVGHVRQLVDDEAEDEDEDDGPIDDEEDDGGAVGDLRDLIAEDPGEKETDRERRSELHCKWLEEQDVAVEDSILNRLGNRWQRKGRELPSILSESEAVPVTGKTLPKSSERRRRVGLLLSAGGSKSLEVSEERPKDLDLGELGTGGSQVVSEPLGRADMEVSSSDDEETEGKLRRQLILEESEEQTEFLSVTDDDSSRDIFTLINKVNVTTVKPRSTIVHPDARTAGTSHSHLPLLQHQMSFLKRRVTTATTTRQGAGVSRSYIFGRDDSNSRDSNRANDKTMLQAEKENFCPSADNNTALTTHRKAKPSTNVDKHSTQNGENSSAPSLFQILKQQAADLASSNATANLKSSRATANDLASFLAVRPPRRTSNRCK